MKTAILHLAIALLTLTAPRAVAALPSADAPQFRFTDYVGYVVGKGDSTICTSLEKAKCSKEVIARAEQTKPSGGVARGNPDPNKNSGVNFILSAVLCTGAGVALGMLNEKEKNGIPVGSATQ